ncbi:EAL domain-containing protein [Burkholderia sp. Ac-20379]|uniref:EAL domain-containing protein n=2 Tax=Burkholderia sp. Ac-20379 TaxID=2703900 RepID=UPI001D771DFB|nr:EAL domain-containing protein [Burkholderia sp. Ac-20379]MBN3728058.1 EAL domain-containing protein [Burkholderia sp. Ac-20379]
MSTSHFVRPEGKVYERMIRSIADYAIYMLDIDGYVTTWNAGAQRAKGYLEHEIVGRHFSCFYTRSDRARSLAEFNLQIARNEGRFEDHGWRVRKDGTIFWAHVVIDALRNEDGEIFGFAKITRDCTERRMVETQSRQREQSFRFLVQSVTDYAIYMLDVNGIVSNWNAGAQAAKGYTSEEIVGQHFSRFYTPEDREAGAPARALDTALRDGRFETEGWRVRKNGERFWAHVVIDPIFDDAGELFGFAKVTRDRTEARRLQQQTIDQERRFRLLVEGVTDYAIYMLNVDGIVSNWNAGAQRAKGYTASEIIGRHFSVFFTEDDRKAGTPARGLQAAREHGKFEAQAWRVRKDGQRFWAHVVIHPIYDDDGALYGYSKITRDCTEQRQAALALEATTRNLDLALDNMLQGLCLFDRHGRLVLSNRQFSHLFDLSETPSPGIEPSRLLRLLGRPVRFAGRARSSMAAQFRQAVMSGHTEEKALVVGFLDRYVSVVTRQLSHGGWVTTFEDVTERRHAEAQIHHLAHHDPLTGLPNRLAFQERLHRMLERAQPGHQFSLLYLDLDRFKAVNDTLGHQAGDELLQAVSARLSANLRESDQLARLGGDEFTILQSRSRGLDEAIALAERCIRTLADSFVIRGAEVSIGVSIGIAALPCGLSSSEVALQCADIALYAAKQGGRNGYRVYRDEMHGPIRERNELEVDLRRAMAGNQLRLHYQPIVEATTGRTTAAEALLRWTHPVRGPITPAAFIPLAEERGHMPALGAWVLVQACRDAISWPDEIRISVNVSPAQVVHPDFLNTVIYALKVSRLPPRRLELEITETALLESSARSRAVLGTIRSMGVGIAMDDFGTGYSSLSLLQDFPFSRIKIDRSFVQNIGKKRKSTAIVSAIAGLCQRLDIPVIAEGVETDEQRLALIAERCSEFQGFLFARPVPVEQLPWYKGPTA